MRYELWIGLRYLKAKGRRGFLSLLAGIAIMGITLGVGVLIVVLAVMSGFEDDLREKILGFSSHIWVTESGGRGIAEYPALIEKVKQVKGVKAASPFIFQQVMLSSGGFASGAVLQGVDPRQEGSVTELGRFLKQGTIRELAEVDSKGPAIFLGRELARTLGVLPGDVVTVISPQGAQTAVGMIPKMRPFRVAGLFEVGHYQYDYGYAYISMAAAQEFFGTGDRVSGIEVRVADIDKTREVARAIQQTLGFPFWTRDWIEMNKTLFSAIQLEKLVMFVILSFIVLVAAFAIVSHLIMVVMEKRKEIAILKSMGATARSIMLIFMVEGLLIGLVGTVIGCLLGYGIVWVQDTYRIVKLPSEVYMLPSLPMRMKLLDFLMVSLAALAITFLATLYPSRRAAKLHPVEVLRYE